MALRYYPAFAIKANLVATGNFTLNGVPYSGKYYLTQEGEAFSGPDPETGPNERLTPRLNTAGVPGLNTINIPQSEKVKLINKTELQSTRVPGKPNSFYPQPTAADYKRGYLIRYFTKKENERGFIIEISPDEYDNIINGTTDYDIRLYQTTKILWKITGPLRNQRKSQYNVIPGIIDTNQRLTEEANKTFLGIVDYIGGDYTKYAKPTQ